MSKALNLTLIGFANSGKTTLSNRLTGQSKTTGNWTGVTVGHSKGQFTVADSQYQVTDLPGLSNLASTGGQSKDVEISQQFLQSSDTECIVNVIDATQVQRQLF